jgi:3-deoxy-D-manno-octulosonic-acid transferase
MLPPGLLLYRALTRALQPFAGSLLRSRARKGKEDPARLGERLGRADAKRPQGPLVWLHGASVGESLMLRALLEAIRRERPDIRFLVTTGTVTSAEMMAKRLPDCATHQYVPLDAPDAVRAFLDHWRPDLGAIAESELWPNLILGAHKRGVKLALVNARLTAGSLERWRRRSPASARKILSCFDWIGAADEHTASGLSELSGRPVPISGNLKLAGGPLGADPTALADAKAATGERFVWVAASTHPGEDEIVLEAHKLIRAERRNALLILVPRHPERGPSVADLAQKANFSTRRRAAGEAPDATSAVYVADTLGEMGLWLRLATAAFVGGSLVDRIGGHNPLEPAALGAPIVAGPHTFNFAPIYEELVAAGGAVRVQSAAELAREIRILEGPVRWERIQAAQTVASGGGTVLEAVMQGIRPLLPAPL